MSAKKYFLAFDIERTGAAKRHGVWAVGIAFGTQDGTLIEKRAFCSKANPEDFSPNTLEWALREMPEAMGRINREAIHAHMRELHTYLLNLQTRFGPFGRRHKATVDLRLVTDNPAYDAHWINDAFQDMFGGDSKTLSELFDDYVPTDDPTEQQRFLTADERDYVEECVKIAPHDHYPANDAEQIYRRQCALEVIASRRRTA